MRVHWGRVVCLFHALFSVAFSSGFLAWQVQETNGQMAQKVANFFLNLGTLIYPGLLMTFEGVGGDSLSSNGVSRKILSFFRLMLTTHFFTYGLFVSLVAYSMKTDSEYFSYKYCVVLLTLLSIMLFLSMVVFVPWTSQEVRLSYKREKSMLANASIVLIVLGTILVIYALVWLSAIVAILLPVDVMLLSLATTFRFISTALGPSLFIALKWRGAGYFGRYDLVVSAFSLGMNFVAAIVMFFDTVVNTDWNARVTFTFPQGLYLVGYLIMALGFGLGITAAYLVNRSCEKGFASLIPSVDDAVYPPPVMPGSNSLPPPMYSPPGSVAANYQQQAVLLQYDK